MNLEMYDEWKDTEAVKWLFFFLDAVLQEFIAKQKITTIYLQQIDLQKTQSLGLGVLGWHSYLQK